MLTQTQFKSEIYDVKKWNGEKLGSTVAVDTETTIAPFTSTPDLVTLQAMDGDCVYYVNVEDVSKFLEVNESSTFVMHNAPFDIDVIGKHVDNMHIFHNKIEQDKLKDTSLLYKLLHLATIGFVPFKYNLAMLSEKFLGFELEKGEERITFEQYLGKPVEKISDNHLSYGALDVIVTYKLYHHLMSRIRQTGSTTELSHQIQLVGSLALNRIYKRGIGFNVEQAREKLNQIEFEMNKAAAQLEVWGWIRGQKGCNKRYEYIVNYLKLDLPRTESGDISSKADDLEPFRYEPFIDNYVKFHEYEKLSTFIRKLDTARVHPRYDVIKNTGRTGCSKPNFQQLPREGGIRELFQAKPGHTFIITDYSAIELAILAQITYSRYNESTMRDMINDGMDLHRYYASVLHEVPQEEITKQQRQEAKAANFGFPGGLGIETFIEFSKGYGLELSQAKAQDMKDAWFAAFPEMKYYMEEKEDGDAAWTMSGRKRANASYCARKNTPFQGSACDGAKIALYNLDNLGVNVVGFVHDEIISEVPLDLAEKFKDIQEQVMIESMQTVAPDVRISVESTISPFYCK